MRYILTRHAGKRMRERNITQKMLENALKNPTKVLYDVRNRLSFKKIYTKGSRQRLLLIVGEVNGNELVIITVIDTSKVKKYL